MNYLDDGLWAVSLSFFSLVVMEREEEKEMAVLLVMPYRSIARGDK